MDGHLSWAILGAAGGAVVALLLVLSFALLRRRRDARSDLAAMLGAAQREVDDLRLRLDIANARLEGHTGVRRQGAGPDATRDATEYLITDAGSSALLLGADRLLGATPATEQVEVPDRLVLSATLGAPLVKVAAFSHGVRRALSAESRNRIWFEMRKEVRAARKRRKRLVRDHLRQVRADDRAGEAV